MKRSLHLWFLFTGGCVSSFTLPPLPLNHPANVAAPVAPATLPSDTLAARPDYPLYAKYTEDGGAILLSVSTERRRDEGEDAVIRVRDSGVGIPSEMLPRVFDLFAQAEHTLDRAQGGLGIGLALVRRLVEMHGGSVSAFSDASRGGSEFVVRLPTVTAPADSTVRKPQAGGPNSDGKRRVLVADDNVDSAQSLALLLRMLGNTVMVAHDGVAAVAMARQFRPDIAVLDLGMPKLDGCRVANDIRKEPWGRGMFLIAVTGWGQEEFRNRTRHAGFDAHLVKPVDLRALAKLFGEAPAASGAAVEAD